MTDQDINQKLTRIEDVLSQVVQALALLTGDPELRERSGADILERHELSGAVMLRQVEDHKRARRADYPGDQRAQEIIDSQPDYFLWSGVVADEDEATRAKILINSGEREAFRAALVGPKRFFSPFDDYDVEIYDFGSRQWKVTPKEGGRYEGVAVAFETPYSDPYTMDEVIRLAQESLDGELDGLEGYYDEQRLRAERGAPETGFGN